MNSLRCDLVDGVNAHAISFPDSPPVPRSETCALCQAPVLLRVLLDSLTPKKIGEDNSTTEVQLADSERRRQELERGWCFELASDVLALLVEHVRSPHSAELWLELHYGLGTATARHRAFLSAPASAQSIGVLDESAECAAVRRTADLLSQAVGHMGGILLREEAIGAKQAALLAEVLSDLTAPDLFWAAGTSVGCRRAVVELLAVALCGLHRHQRLVKAMPNLIRAATTPPRTENSSVDASVVCGPIDSHPALSLSRSLLGGVGAERTVNKPPPMRVTRAVALPPLLEACAGSLSGRLDIALEIVMRIIHGAGLGLVFVGDRAHAGFDGHRGADDDMERGEQGEEESDNRMGALATVKGASGMGVLPIGPVAGKKVSSRELT